MTHIWPSIQQAVKHSSHHAHAPLTWDPTAHLLSRFAFGPTPSQRRHLAKVGPSHWYANQIEFARKHHGYSGHRGIARVGPLLNLSPYGVRQWLIRHGNEYGWDAMDQLTEVTLGLQGWSPAQLYETLVDLFSNHLNVPNHNGDVWNTRHAYDRDVIRKHAMGRFSDMLLASARHPAMLIYLSLADSTKAAVNENYGRELLELHTVGLHYSERDVQNTARMLTGRTLDEHQHYVFDEYIHPRGRIKVLGFSHPNSHPAQGQQAGDELLRYLAHHPDTAANIARNAASPGAWGARCDDSCMTAAPSIVWCRHWITLRGDRVSQEIGRILQILDSEKMLEDIFEAGPPERLWLVEGFGQLSDDEVAISDVHASALRDPKATRRSA